MRLRIKLCDRCQKPAPVLFRVSLDADADWEFVCESCLPQIKDNNSSYRYGGTWKAQKPK